MENSIDWHLSPLKRGFKNQSRLSSHALAELDADNMATPTFSGVYTPLCVYIYIYTYIYIYISLSLSLCVIYIYEIHIQVEVSEITF